MAVKIFSCNFFIIILSIHLFSQQLEWHQLHAPVASSVTSITQLSNGDFYLGTSTRGVFKSIDNGSHWTECNSGFSDLYIDNVYSTADNKLFACSGSSVFQFDWQNNVWVNLNAPQADYNCILVNSMGHIITGSNFGIFRSTNGGTSWQPATTNIASAKSLISIQNDILLAGATYGVYKSTDNGDTWIRSGVSGYNTVSDLYVDNNGDIYASVFYRGEGIYCSKDQGATWEQLNSGLADQLTTSVIVDIEGNIYSGTFEGGIFQKAFNQSSFAQINLHQEMSQILDIYIGQDKTLYICSVQGGIFRRGETELEWKQANTGLPLDHSISLGFDENNNFYMGNLYSGFYRSTDQGDNWFPVAYYMGGSHRFTFLANNNQLFMGTTIEFAYLGMLLRSTDEGENWEYFHQGIPLVHPDYPWIQVVMAMDVNSNGDLFAALNTEGVYRRLTSDTSWHYINSGIPDTNIFSVCVNSNDMVFTGYRNGFIYKSDDNGSSWLESLSDIPGYTVELLKSAGEYVFAVLHNYNYPHQDSSLGLYSSDNGNSWNNLYISGLGSRINSIGFFNNIIVAGSDLDGVFISSDFGESWLNASGGLSDLYIKGITIHPDGYLLCGTEKEGIYFADLNITGMDHPNVAQVGYSIFQNYPNPFNPVTTIKYSLPERSNVVIKIYDILGHEVAALTYDEKPAGSYEVEFNASNLPSGVYFYRLQANSFSETKKMILLK